MADEKALFRAEKKRTDRHRKADGKTCVTCPASRHAQMLAEHVGARKPYPMLQEEPEHCAGSILSTVASLYEARLLLAQNRSLTTLECDALRDAADYLEGDGVSMPAMRADMIAITLRSIAETHGAASGVPGSVLYADNSPGSVLLREAQAADPHGVPASPNDQPKDTK